MTKIKICGLRNLEQALAAAEAGADFLGIVFEPNSSRYVSAEVANSLVTNFSGIWTKSLPKWVGVFANQSSEDVNRILIDCNLDMAQLSGNESMGFCRNIKRPVIRVTHVRSDVHNDVMLEEIKSSLDEDNMIGYISMLDTYKSGVGGGTGQMFNWELAEKIAETSSFFLAGGLTPENVREAIHSVKPWGVDVSSGIETGGEKDIGKIYEFIGYVRRSDSEIYGDNS